MPSSYKNSPIVLGPVTRSIGKMLLERADKRPDSSVFASCEGGGAYAAVTWRKFVDDVAALAGFLEDQGVRLGDRVATFSPNCYEMLAWEMAITSMGAISVPVFSGYGVEHLDYILGHAEPKVILVGPGDRLEKVEACAARAGIRAVVTIEDSEYPRFADLLAASDAARFSHAVSRVKPHHVCFIQYTSGTTGQPKGVMLMHRNIMSQQKALSKVWNISHRSRFLSYLPWHHSFGGLFERFTALYQGATIYLEDSSGKDFDRLLRNWSVARPTQFFSVPKIYIALVTEAKLNPEIREILFHPELEFVFTAAAPLPKECSEYFKQHDIPVYEGWGLTETSPCVTLTMPGKERIHSFVGEPIPGNEIMTNANNEILVKGPNVMKGYYKDPERTKKSIDHYGWFKTGDLGEITEYGLRMICRIDGLFKLSNGEKVSSMMVENALTITSQWVQQAVTLGAAEGFVSALIFPNFRNLRNWANERRRQLPEGWDLSRDPEVQQLIAEEIRQNMQDFQPKYMEVKAFVIIPKELTLEDGELTPTMKVIRHHVVEKYEEWLDVIYHPDRNPEKQLCVVSVSGGAYAVRWEKP
jgi:long-subunit acyl-CoA synthetase (AMP-forming)